MSADLQNKIHHTEEQVKAKTTFAEYNNRIKSEIKNGTPYTQRRGRVQPCQLRPIFKYTGERYFDLFRAGKIRNQKTGIDAAKARKETS